MSNKEKAFNEMVKILTLAIKKLKPIVKIDCDGYIHLDSNLSSVDTQKIATRLAKKYKNEDDDIDLLEDEINQLSIKAIRVAVKKIGYSFGGYDF